MCSQTTTRRRALAADCSTFKEAFARLESAKESLEAMLAEDVVFALGINEVSEILTCTFFNV